MRVHRTPLDLYKTQVASFRAATGSARKNWRQIPEGGRRDLWELTSGGVSSRNLRRMGHPYAKTRRFKSGKSVSFLRRGVSRSYIRSRGFSSARGVAPLLPINRQRGDLYRSVTLWRRSSRYRLEESVGFDAAKAGRSMYAVQPGGTKYVVPRGIWTEIRKRGMVRIRAFRDVYVRDQRAAFAT